MNFTFTNFKHAIILAAFLFAVNLNSQGFEDVLPKAGIEHYTHDDFLMAGGVVVIDYNNDGYEDVLMIGGDDESTKLFRNNPEAYNSDPYDYANMFTDVSDLIPEANYYFTIGGGAFDYNNDGWLDLVLTTDRGEPTLVFENEGGTFKEVSAQLGIIHTFQSTSISFGDVNLDGWPDIYIANYFEDSGNQNCLPNSLFINKNGEFFNEEAVRNGVNDRGCGLANTLSDYDNDGDLDVFVANDFGQAFTSNALYRNEYPLESFTNVKTQVGFDEAILGMGVDGGDYDNDGDIDYYATNLGQNYFYDNQNGQIFFERGKELKIDNTDVNPDEDNSGLTVSWSVNWFDFDLDMDVDLHVTNGYLSPIPDIDTKYADNNRFYENNGKDQEFDEVTEENGLLSPGIDRGAAQIDFDNDGDMDLLTTATRPNVDTYGYRDNDWFKLFENKQNTGRNWLKVKLTGSTTDIQSIGSRVKLYTGNVTQMREVTSGGGGYLSQSTRVLQFGLAENESVDSLEVIWIGKNTVRTKMYDIEANQQLNIIQSYYDTVNVEICKGETLFDKTWENHGFHNEQFVAANGADSNVNYNIIVNIPDSINTNVEICKGETFEGQEWDESGLKYVTYINSKGCDSVVAYNVEVLQPQESVIDTAICYSSFFQGKQYIRDTTLVRSLKGANGCDSLVTFNIEVLEAPNYTENFDVCYGDIFRGKIIVKQEIFSDKFKSDQNCDSVHTIVVNPLPESRFRDTVQLNYGESFKGKEWTEDGIYSNKIEGGAFNGCDSVYIVDVFVTPTSIFDTRVDNKLGVSVTPNPFNEITTIEFNLDQSEGTRVELMNHIGQSIPINYNPIPGTNRFELNAKELGLSNGLYYLKIITPRNTYVTKILRGN